ncbi:MAG: HNH endonuclease [Ardenticatenaceae bacterium]|nr:HNH endonuclease [Ardenticatenaceae bacterium]
MPTDISAELRKLVTERANHRCEYCLLPEKASLHKHEPDHIVPRQHGGESAEANLALSCLRCNRYKGPNIGSYDPETGELTPFFNPRQQSWSEHFKFDGAEILALTAVARVTLKILRINDDSRIREREQLQKAGLFD